MATWIAHLRVAEHLLSVIPGLQAGQFALGSIAPDSGIPDRHRKNFTPPPVLTHFFYGEGDVVPLEDLRFFHRHLAGLSVETSPALFSFHLGYFFHLLTDNLWAIEVALPTRARYPDQFAASRDFIWEVKKDWYGLDFHYVRSHPHSLFFTHFLQPIEPAYDLEFLPPDALAQRAAYIRAYYQRDDEEVREKLSRPYQYLSQARMDCLVERMAGTLARVYQALWPQRRDPGAQGTALTLVGYPPIESLFTAAPDPACARD